MKAKISTKQKKSVIILGSLVLVFILSAYFVPKEVFIRAGSKSLVANISSFYNQEKVNLPVRLKIPKIGVDTFVESVGRTTKGEVGVPKGPSNSAWFNLGPRPGENGSAIISGHYGWKDDQPAVFDNLAKLKKGDKLFIIDDQGATTTFMVSKSQRYSSDSSALKVFSSNDGKAHLNLITCEGVWDKISKTYSNRLVVFADKE